MIAVNCFFDLDFKSFSPFSKLASYYQCFYGQKYTRTASIIILLLYTYREKAHVMTNIAEITSLMTNGIKSLPRIQPESTLSFSLVKRGHPAIDMSNHIDPRLLFRTRT